jgi:hypothetical protein
MMNKIKQALDEELKDIEVSEQLKMRLISKMKKQKSSKLINFNTISNKYGLKAMTSVSSFILILTITVNMLPIGTQPNTLSMPESNSQEYDFSRFNSENNKLNEIEEPDTDKQDADEEEQGVDSN